METTNAATGVSLAERFRGTLIIPQDPTYDDARRVWNAMIDFGPPAADNIRP